MEVLRNGYTEKELVVIFTEKVDHQSIMSCGGYGNCNCD